MKRDNMNTLSKIRAEESKEKEEMMLQEEEEEEEDKEDQKAKPQNNKPQPPKSLNKLLERVLCTILFTILHVNFYPSYTIFLTHITKIRLNIKFITQKYIKKRNKYIHSFIECKN